MKQLASTMLTPVDPMHDSGQNQTHAENAVHNGGLMRHGHVMSDDRLDQPGQNSQRLYVLREEDDGTVELSVDALKPADSPRGNGVDVAHSRTLAETDAVLPPILVHRSTMRVVDGMHRLQAARLNGAKTIVARFFHGDDEAAFVEAVKSNIAHGLPLSLADRKAASLRIITAHPQWSDRMIADVTGLAHKTVGALRRREAGVAPAARVGRDGRVRPLNGGDGRLRASELLAENPTASPEEVGQAAGISPTTVKDVRKRLRRGEDPLPRRQRVAPVQPVPGPDRAMAIKRLVTDPSLRFTEAGRTLLRWLHVGPRTVEEAVVVADRMPEHHLGSIGALARQTATMWQQLAVQLEQRANGHAPPGPAGGHTRHGG